MLHELATNSLKYGALSCGTGTLDVACDTPGGVVTLVWTERGGPEVTPPSGQDGYGSNLLRRGMRDQLGGEVTFDWPPEGAVITLQMDKHQLEA